MRWISVLSMVVLSFGLAGCGSKDSNPLVSSDSNNLDVSYISSECFAAVVVHPQRLLKSLALPEETIGPLLKDAEDDLGFSIRSVEQLVMVFPEPDMGGGFGFGGSDYDDSGPPSTYDGSPYVDDAGYEDYEEFEHKDVPGTQDEIHEPFESPDSPDFNDAEKDSASLTTGRIFYTSAGEQSGFAEETDEFDGPPFEEGEDFYEDEGGMDEFVEHRPVSNDPGMIVRFSKDMDTKQIIASMLEDPQERTDQGKEYFVDGGGWADRAAFAPDARTIVAAPEALLQKMLTAKNAKSPLIDRLRKMKTDKDVLGVFVMTDGLRTMAGFGAMMLSQDPDFKDAGSVVSSLDAAMFALDFSGAELLQVAVEMKDDDSAEKMLEIAENGLETAKAQYKMMKPMIAEGAPESIVNTGEDVLNGVTIKQAGTHVILSVKQPENLAKTLLEGVIEARKAAEVAQRKNNLKQIGLAFHFYHDTYHIMPPSKQALQESSDKEGYPNLSWRVHLLPYIESSNLYEQFRLDEPWNSEYNLQLLDQMPDVYRTTEHDDKTTMLMVVGPGTAYEGKQGFRFADIVDGMSHTILVVEAGADKAVPWTKPEDLPFVSDNPIEALGDLSMGTFLALFCDGSVQEIEADIAPEHLKALFTRDGEEVVPEDVRW